MIIMDGNLFKVIIYVKGVSFVPNTDYKNHPANQGKDFDFDGRISEAVLKNYLSRSMNISVISNPSEDPAGDRRLVLRTGAKYLYRANMMWLAETDYSDAAIHKYKAVIDDYHDADPDIVFEANVLETVHVCCARTPVPDWLFAEFDQPVESRGFDYDKMIFTSGKYVNYWGDGFSVPDSTRIETQMYLYYRARRYIDAGFESIHWCQLMLVGEDDENYAGYHKVITKIREYAKAHSRRHFVLQTGSTQGMLGPDGKLLLDFHTYPTRDRKSVV